MALALRPVRNLSFFLSFFLDVWLTFWSARHTIQHTGQLLCVYMCHP